ncbi:MAG TPA: BTAD domain-containing putative transcriptional regulator, partial [Pseudonocardiaceae bacterium]|nr:BTAD domain-containing putative transcriptional regulator [Pseudonocardiaceae bacterium]
MTEPDEGGRFAPPAHHGPLRFALLGQVRVWRDSAAVDVGTPQQQAVLAMLVLRAGHPVDLDELVDGVWGGDPPRTAVGTVRTYASRLRAGLGDTVLRTVGRGYLLDVPAGAIDVSVFERDVHAARMSKAAGHLTKAAELLRSALALCNGRPLFGVPGPYADAMRDRLAERRLQVLHDRVDVDIALGRHEQLVGELTGLCAEFPLREEFRAQLMLVLYRSGRPAEALSVYADTARLLADELGVDPGPELAKLHERILRLDDTLVEPHADTVVRPAQLPADTADFTGRRQVVADLTAVLGERRGSSVVVSAVAGIGGIGKTSLAVHVAHAAVGGFPDGQLYANLRGARAEPAEPAVVLAGFLRALGVADSAVPDGVDERAALYRSVLADRRVLVVLDDARDVRQVRPLLPGSASCAVIVTSRSRLATLPATRRVDLDVLEPDEAVALLSRIAGAERVAAEHGAALALVCSCGLLPLAVRIVGARLAARSSWTVASMASRLACERDRLAELRADDLDVAACFRLGYDQLDPVAARAFRLLAVPDVPDIGLPAAAAALDLSEREAVAALERLVDLAMLESVGSDRYRYHDLLRLFARMEAERRDSPADRGDVLVRLLDFQL